MVKKLAIKFIISHHKSATLFGLHKKEEKELKLFRPCDIHFSVYFNIFVQEPLQGMVVSQEWENWKHSVEVRLILLLEIVNLIYCFIDYEDQQRYFQIFELCDLWKCCGCMQQRPSVDFKMCAME